MTKKQSKFSLGKHLKIEDAKKLHKRLSTCADKKVDVTINAEKVSSLDMSALQLLISFVQKVSDNGNTVHWHKPSDALLSTVALTDLSAHLDLVVANRTE